jgi:SAM-dependent methyltransferase
MGAAWTEFYRGRLLSESYRGYCAERYAPFLDTIRGYMKTGDRIIEVGCGLGTMTALLAAGEHPFVGFRCFDVSAGMVSLAKLNLQDQYPVDMGDARLPTCRYPDIVHSHGMLEHLSDRDINLVVDAGRLDGARVGVHYVPGEKYEKPSFGDERLMSLEDWHRIAKPTHSFTFNDGYDHCLIWDYTK